MRKKKEMKRNPLSKHTGIDNEVDYFKGIMLFAMDSGIESVEEQHKQAHIALYGKEPNHSWAYHQKKSKKIKQ